MKTGLNRLLLKLAQSKFKAKRADFYYELSMSLFEHVPLVTTLRKYEQRARNRGSTQNILFLNMLRGLQSGGLSSAMNGIATPMELILISSTQSAGDQAMADGLKFLSEMVRKLERTREILIVSISYPLLLLCIFVGMMVAFALMAVPVLAELLAPEKWPPLGRLLYWMSYGLTQYGIYVLALCVGGLIAFALSLPLWTSALRRRLDDHFPYNIYRDYVGAVLLMALAAMMRSGVSLRTALERSQQFAKPWMKWHVRKIMQNLARPTSPYFGQAFQSGVLNQAMCDKVQDASERRDPVASFIRAGSMAIDEMTEVLHRRFKILNIAMIVSCGLILAVMFGGFFSTTMAIQSGIRTT
jgi:type II secretory pathway component PulF